jgi:hypothetical protein
VPSALATVSEDYQKSVKPILEKKCFDCHSRYGHQPWYYSLPIVKQVIDRDIREARADIDMSEGFPFLGKGTPADYLDVLKDTVNDGSMPPFRYRIAHSGSALTEEERTAILGWISRGTAALGDAEASK